MSRLRTPGQIVAKEAFDEDMLVRVITFALKFGVSAAASEFKLTQQRILLYLRKAGFHVQTPKFIDWKSVERKVKSAIK